MTATQLALSSINTWSKSRSAYGCSGKQDLVEITGLLLELSAKVCGLETPFYFRAIEGKDKTFLIYDGVTPDCERLVKAVNQVAHDLLLFWEPQELEDLPTDPLKQIYNRYVKSLAFAIGSWGSQSANLSLLEKVVRTQSNVHIQLEKTPTGNLIYLVGQREAVLKTRSVFKELFQLEEPSCN